MVSKGEEVVSFFFSCLFQVVAIGESVANGYGAIQHSGQREKLFGRGSWGGNRTGVNNLQHADAEVGRCA